MNLRRTHTREIAAAKAGFSTSTGARLDADPRLPSQKRTATRPAPCPIRWRRSGTARSCRCCEPAPGLRPITMLREMQRRHAGFPDDLRRTLERRIRLWQALHGPEREVIFRQEHPPGQQGSVGFHRCHRARRQHRRRPARAPALSLPPGVLRLAACRRRAGRRELRRPGRGLAECPVGSRRRAAGAPQRQPLGGVPQSRAGCGGGSDRSATRRCVRITA